MMSCPIPINWGTSSLLSNRHMNRAKEDWISMLKRIDPSKKSQLSKVLYKLAVPYSVLTSKSKRNRQSPNWFSGKMILTWLTFIKVCKRKEEESLRGLMYTKNCSKAKNIFMILSISPQKMMYSSKYVPSTLQEKTSVGF